MRIGIITGEYPPMQGGVGAYTQILANIFCQHHEVFVLSQAPATEENNNVHMTHISGWSIKVLQYVRQWIDTHNLDIVNIQFETAAFSMSPWVHFLPNVIRNVPFITTFHDLLFPYLFPKAGPLRHWIVMHLAAASDGVIATNHEDYARLQHLPRSALIPIGSNITPQLLPDYNRLHYRQKAGAAEQDVLLAHFGFVNHSKGLETLLRAVSNLRAEGFPAKILMIGGRTGTSDPANAAYANEIDLLIDKLELKGHIHWTGFVDDAQVSTYLDTADMVILPFRDGASYRRGSLMAAIQHGSKIITTQPVVPIPTFTHGENMLLFPISDIQALQTLIKEVASGQYADLAKGTRALAQAFDWNLIAADCVALFTQVLEQSR